MTLGRTTTDSVTHTMTLTRRHRTTLLECEARKLHLKKGVMLWPYTLNYYFFSLYLLLPLYIMTYPFVSCNSLELDYPLTPRLGQDTLQTGSLFLSLSITCFTLAATVPLRVHQYLLMHDLCAPFVPASPHRYLMYHCTVGVHLLPLLHVYDHAPYACFSGISTGRCSALY